MQDIVLILGKNEKLCKLAGKFGSNFYKVGNDQWVIEFNKSVITIEKDQSVVQHYDKTELEGIFSFSKKPLFLFVSCNDICFLFEGLRNIREEYEALVDDDHGFLGSIDEFVNERKN